MIPRTLEPEEMGTPEEASDYDAMDHSGVNRQFALDFLAAHGPCRGGLILDAGTGTAQIPIQIALLDAHARFVAADLSDAMLLLGARNVGSEGLGDRIQLVKVDAKGFDEPDGAYEAVVSNSLVHHVPEPRSAMAEMARLVAPGGTLFCRDLARPDSMEEVRRFVELYASDETERARSLFADSLRAALTLGEVRGIVDGLGFDPREVDMTSDRHWTWVRKTT